MSNILIIDDQLLLLEILRMALEGEHVVETARSGMEAMEILDHWPTDLVITDYAMPGMSGMDVIRELRDMKYPPKAILYSACLNPELEQEALALGAIACVPKPFDLQELREMIEKEFYSRGKQESL